MGRKKKLPGGTGVRAEKFHSDFGAGLLKKFGWEDGQGLGLDAQGIVEPIQVRRRETNEGVINNFSLSIYHFQLGADILKSKDYVNWWESSFNEVAKRAAQTSGQRKPDNNNNNVSEDDEFVSLSDMTGEQLYRLCTH